MDNKLQYIFDNAQVGIAICNTEENTLEMVNPAFARIHGYESDELVGVSLGEMFAAESMQRLQAHDPDGNVSFETVHTKKDGSTVLVAIHISHVKDEKGNIKHRIANIIDITERKQQEELLRQKEAEFRSLAENSTDPIFRYDTECRRLYVNPAVERLSGIPASKLLGKTPSEETTIPMKEALRIEEAIHKVVQTGKPEMLDLLFISPDGKEHYFRNNHIPEFDSSGTITSVLAISYDVTATKMQEKLLAAVRKSEEKLNNLFELSPLGIALTDINGRYIEFNDAFCTMCGYTLEELKELDNWALTPIEYEKQEREQFESLMQTGRYGPYEKVYRQKNGNLIPIQLNGVLVKDNNGDEYIWSIVEDITERKRSEQQLKQAMEFNEEIINTIPDLLFETDKNGIYLNVWAQDETLLASQKSALIGNSIKDILPPDVVEISFEAMREVDEKGHSNGKVFSLNLPEGKKWFEISTTKRKSSGTYITLSRDITERKNQEELSRQKEAEFRALAENSPDIIIRYDLDFRRIYINPMGEKLFGCPAREIIGKKPLDASPVSAAIFMDKFREVLETKCPTEIEAEFITPTGEKGWGHNRIVPEFDLNGQIISILTIGRDITEHKKHEELLRQKETEFRSLAEKTPDTIARYDRDCNRTYANPSFAALTGLPSKELLGKKPTSYNFSVQAVAYEEKLVEAMQTGFEQEVEYSWPDKTGQMITSHIRIIPEKDEDGIIRSALAIGRDITKLKTYEARLKHNEIRLKEAQKVAKIGSLEMEYPGLKIDFSEETLRIFEIDFAVSSFSYDHILDVVHPDDRVQVDRKLSEAIENKIPYEIDHRLLFKDGRTKYVRQKWETHFDISGKPIRSVGTVQDVTVYQHQAEQLALKEAEFRALAENTPDNIVRWDTEGRYLYINPVLERTLGITAAETIGTFIPDSYEAIKTAVGQVAATGERIIISQSVPIDDGSIQYHEVSIVPERDASGQIVSVLGIGHDITERKRAEEALHSKSVLLESILESSPDVITFALDTEYNYIAFNQNHSHVIHEIWGHNIAIGMNMLECITREDDRERAKVLFDKALAGEFFVDETAYGDEHLSRSYWQTYYSPMHDDNGETIGLTCFNLNITDKKEQEEHLQRTKAKLSAVISTIPDMIWVKDGDGTYMMCNPQYMNFIGAAEGEFIGKTDYDFYETDTADICKQSDLEAIASGTLTLSHETFVNPDSGAKGTWEVRKMPVFNSEEFMGVLGIGRDITERIAIEKELRQKEASLNEAQKIAKMGSWELEFPGLHLSWSDEIYRIFEIDPEKFQPSYDQFLNLIHPHDRERIDAAFAESLKNKSPYSIVHRLMMKDRRIKYVHERGTTYFDEQGDPIRSVGTVQDITEQKNIEKKIEYMAHHDPLTKLPNRIVAKERADQAIALAKRHESKTALLFIDLDGFKSINDSLGHSVGDTMLKIIASRLQEIIRETDTLSRQGGDEFLLILSEIKEQEDIVTITDKLLRQLEKSFKIGVHTLTTSASIGIAIYPDHGDTFELLLQNADTAMYKVKERGRNGYCFYEPQMNYRLAGEFKLQNDLRIGIRNNEFTLHYQPQIDLAQKNIIGAEALIRWHHPKMGMIPPMDFIPIAESSGLIVQIGEWVIQEACRQAALWHQQGIMITMAVNISSIQFKRGNLVEIVENALKKSHIDPKYLELEITESVMMHDINDTLKAVHELKALGVHLSIDDFGTGYSSLAYLKRFAVDKLKIDQSFVKDIMNNQDDAAIVSAIVQMAKSLNLKTIAEGVEDGQVLALVDTFGCDAVQGYHFAKPMPVAEFEKYHSDYIGRIPTVAQIN